MPCLLRRLISVVFAKAAPGVYTPPLEEQYKRVVKISKSQPLTHTHLHRVSFHPVFHLVMSIFLHKYVMFKPCRPILTSCGWNECCNCGWFTATLQKKKLTYFTENSLCNKVGSQFKLLIYVHSCSQRKWLWLKKQNEVMQQAQFTESLQQLLTSWAGQLVRWEWLVQPAPWRWVWPRIQPLNNETQTAKTETPGGRWWTGWTGTVGSFALNKTHSSAKVLTSGTGD